MKIITAYESEIRCIKVEIQHSVTNKKLNPGYELRRFKMLNGEKVSALSLEQMALRSHIFLKCSV